MEDGEQVLAMVEPLGKFTSLEATGLGAGPGDTFKPTHFYRCKNLVDSDCSIYDQRPAVCREYPYRGQPCRYADCTRTTAPEPTGELVKMKAGG